MLSAQGAQNAIIVCQQFPSLFFTNHSAKKRNSIISLVLILNDVNFGAVLGTPTTATAIVDAVNDYFC